MERVIITNYQEVKEELIDYITTLKRNRYDPADYLALEVDPAKCKLCIKLRFDESYYYPFDVVLARFHELYEEKIEDIEEKAIDLLDAAFTTFATEYGIEIELQEKMVIALDRSSIYPSIFVKTYFGGDPHEAK